MTYHRGARPNPYQTLRRWARHTPNGTIALNMISIGTLLILASIVLAITVF